MGAILTNISEIFAKSGWAQIFFAEGGWKYAVMLAVACVLLYLASRIVAMSFCEPRSCS